MALADDPDIAQHLDARWALVLPLREHMLAVARRRCISDEDAEDCVHEAMLRVVRFEALDPGRVEAMLTSVTTRLAVDLHRGRERARRYQPRLVHVPEQQAPPDEAVLDAGEARWLASRVEHLPEREREVFRQRAAGYSAGEAAERLSLSYKAVESAFTRARGRMRAWATAGTLLVLEYLRRLRQRPNTVLAATMAMVSAGFVIISVLPGRPAPGERSHLVPALGAPAWSQDAAPLAGSAQGKSGAGSGQPPAASGSHRRGGSPPPPPPSSGVTHHQIFATQVPVPGPNGPLGLDISSYSNNGNYVDDQLACLEQQPNLNSNTIGCPPPQ